MLMRYALVILLLFGGAQCYFTKHFNNFIIKHYGKEVQKSLERLDVAKNHWGHLGSFGGKLHDGSVIKKRPIIFVHGITQTASAFLSQRHYFIKKGYHISELYATTWGDGGKTLPLDITIKCAFFRQIRRMIEVVVHYTCSKVDIIAWSMGSAVTRKAILGGTCADTNETLGKQPITAYVDTFLTTGGVNHGSERCPLEENICNNVNSMYCDSILLKELNSQKRRYEGTSSFALYSPNDWIIGRKCCGQECGALRNANASIAIAFLSHVTISVGTVQVQYDILDHESYDAKLNASACALNEMLSNEITSNN
uniref:Lipase n=1 Tax=Parascaris univalens TaxID=6257 RepID=A0A915BAV5_PARUN